MLSTLLNQLKLVYGPFGQSNMHSTFTVEFCNEGIIAISFFLSNSKWFQQGAFLFLLMFSKSNFIVVLDKVCNMYYFLASDLFLLNDNHIPTNCCEILFRKPKFIYIPNKKEATT